MKKDIDLYDKEAFLKMHEAGKLAADVLDYITSYVKSGVSTGYLNDLCHDYILKNDAIPAPLNYRGFPKSTCISVVLMVSPINFFLIVLFLILFNEGRII